MMEGGNWARLKDGKKTYYSLLLFFFHGLIESVYEIHRVAQMHSWASIAIEANTCRHRYSGICHLSTVPVWFRYRNDSGIGIFAHSSTRQFVIPAFKETFEKVESWQAYSLHDSARPYTAADGVYTVIGIVYDAGKN